MQCSTLAEKLHLGGVFINNSPKATFSIVTFKPNSFCRTASFELPTTKIGRAFVKLLDSTFQLEIPIPASKEGFLGHNSKKAHPLAQTTSSRI
jgi:hypothetical protein